MEALKLTEKQKHFLASNSIVFDFENMSDDDFVELEERIGNVLVFDGLDRNNDDNRIGEQAREILEMLV